MGLDIYVIKPCPPSEADESEYYEEGYKHTENPKVIRSFPQYVQEVQREVDDWAALGHPEFETDEYWENHSFISSDHRFIVFDDPGNKTGSGYYEPSEETLQGIQDRLLYIFNVDDIPQKTIVTKVIPFREVGYQRKGANQKFYEDGKWENEELCVVTQEELEYDLEHYFSSESPESVGGWGSFTEYSGVSDLDRAKNFKENIMSHFTEGETAVMYW